MELVIQQIKGVQIFKFLKHSMYVLTAIFPGEPRLASFIGAKVYR